MKPVTLKVGPIEESALVANHRVIREVIGGVITFIAKGLAKQKDFRPFKSKRVFFVTKGAYGRDSAII